jgi:hypothetical protein
MSAPVVEREAGRMTYSLVGLSPEACNLARLRTVKGEPESIIAVPLQIKRPDLPQIVQAVVSRLMISASGRRCVGLMYDPS